MFGVIGLVVSGVSLVVDIVGLAIPFWLYTSLGGGSASYGLWQGCGSVGGVTECASYPTVPDSLKATRAMEVLGMLALVAAVGCFALKLFVMKQQTMLPKVGAAMAIIAGTFVIIGCVIFAVKFKKDFIISVFNLHAGFGLCIVAAIGAYVSAVLSILNRQE